MFPEKLTVALAQYNLPSLDGLRALAVALVVLYHFGAPINGGMGVTMFFVLSGFLITWLLLNEEKRWGDISLRSFYIRRSLRIFPAFYVFWFLVVIVLGAARGKSVDWKHAITSFLYVGNYYQAFSGQWGTALFHTWSLAIEEQFYLIWPTIFIALRNNRRRAQTLMVAMPVIWTYRFLLFLLGVDQAYLYTALDTRADHLMIGCLTAVMLFTRRSGGLWQALAEKMWEIWITISLMCISSVATTILGTNYRDTLGFIVDPILTVVLLVQVLCWRPFWLNSKSVRYIGRISYSVYLYHMLGIALSAHLLRNFAAPVQLVGAVSCILLLASSSYYLVERPFLLLKDRVGKRAVELTARRAMPAP